MTATLATRIELDDRNVAWIAGTKIKVSEVVLDRIAYRSSPEEIHFQHSNLSLAQIDAALTYYYENQDRVAEQIARGLEDAGNLASPYIQHGVPAQAGESEAISWSAALHRDVLRLRSVEFSRVRTLTGAEHFVNPPLRRLRAAIEWLASDFVRRWFVKSKPSAKHADGSAELPLEERIRVRAHELYIERGNESGSETDDWLQAEEEVAAAQEGSLERD